MKSIVCYLFIVMFCLFAPVSVAEWPEDDAVELVIGREDSSTGNRIDYDAPYSFPDEKTESIMRMIVGMGNEIVITNRHVLNIDTVSILGRPDITQDDVLEIISVLSRFPNLRILEILNCGELDQIPEEMFDLPITELNLYGTTIQGMASFVQRMNLETLYHDKFTISQDIISVKRATAEQVEDCFLIASNMSSSPYVEIVDCDVNVLPKGLLNLPVEKIVIRDTEITDYSPLSSMHTLQEVELPNCMMNSNEIQISQVSQDEAENYLNLTNLFPTVKNVKITNSSLSAIPSALSELPVTHLYLHDNYSLTDISELKELPDLIFLNIEAYHVEDYTVIANCQGLTHLVLGLEKIDYDNNGKWQYDSEKEHYYRTVIAYDSIEFDQAEFLLELPRLKRVSINCAGVSVEADTVLNALKDRGTETVVFTHEMQSGSRITTPNKPD